MPSSQRLGGDSPGGAPRGAGVPGVAVAWSVVALVAVCGFGVWLMLTAPQNLAIDLWWRETVSLDRGTGTYAIAVWLADIGSALGAASCVAIAAAALFVMRRARDAASLIFAAGATVACSELLKAVVLRNRPSDPMIQAAGSSYPSGHSAGAAAIAVSVALIVAGIFRAERSVARIAPLLAAVWVLGMMWSRTALHVHWLTDTVAGALLGTAVAILSRRLWIGAATSRRHVDSWT